MFFHVAFLILVPIDADTLYIKITHLEFIYSIVWHDYISVNMPKMETLVGMREIQEVLGHFYGL